MSPVVISEMDHLSLYSASKYQTNPKTIMRLNYLISPTPFLLLLLITYCYFPPPIPFYEWGWVDMILSEVEMLPL